MGWNRPGNPGWIEGFVRISEESLASFGLIHDRLRSTLGPSWRFAVQPGDKGRSVYEHSLAMMTYKAIQNCFDHINSLKHAWALYGFVRFEKFPSNVPFTRSHQFDQLHERRSRMVVELGRLRWTYVGSSYTF